VTIAISGRGLHQTFDGGRVTPLAGVDVDVEAGHMVAVVGASGSGKTTLLNVLGLLDRPERGEVLVGGQPTTQLDERRRALLRARHLGFVFQDSLVDHRRTAAENVALACVFAGMRRSARTTSVHAALEAADVDHRAGSLAGTLSGGERQRVAVARAIVHQPTILLCDEPTGNLDEANTSRVFDLLTSFVAGGGAVVLVTHDLELAERCDVVLRVSGGSVRVA
jgi:putative ABC transport system ATP-binding protein